MASCSYSSLSPSSSSTTKKKPTKFFQKTFSSKASSLYKREETVFKKAYELSILCGIEVCVICYGLDGKLRTWPEDIEKVKDMARRYSELSETNRRKRNVNLREFQEKISNDDSKKKKKARLGPSIKYPEWDPRFDNYSVEQLMELSQSLEHNSTRIQRRLRCVVESQKQSNVQMPNMAYQEQRTTNTTMSNLQQKSNQVSMYLFNHGNNTLSQIPVEQSLAPLPDSLMIYQDPNVENYLGFLELQNPNMYCNSNFDVANYSGLLGEQGTDINSYMYNLNNMDMANYAELLMLQGSAVNGSQNVNMYDNNNTNGVSHQLLQFPPAFQSGPVRTHY